MKRSTKVKSSMKVKPSIRGLGGFVAAALLPAGCGEILVDEQMVEFDGTGVVRGSIHLDQNGNRAVDMGDEPLSGVSVQVVQPSGGSAVAAAVSDEAGQFLMETFPVGTFRLTVDPLILAGTLEILGGESPWISCFETI